MNRKKKSILIIVCSLYLVVLGGLCYHEYIGQKSDKVDSVDNGTEADSIRAPESETTSREFPVLNNNSMYAVGRQSVAYQETEDILVMERDMHDLSVTNNLPALERMSSQDAASMMTGIQVLERIDALGIDKTVFGTPEYNWKSLYSDSLVAVRDALLWKEVVTFKGTLASELNAFLKENHECIVEIQVTELRLDETILVPSNVILQGNGVRVFGESNLEYAILLENAENVGIYNMEFLSGYREGIYLICCNRVLLYGNELTGAECKAVCVMGASQNVNIVSNLIHDNGNGAVFLDGNISGCIIQGNSIYENRGTRNLTAGIVLCSVELEDIYTPYNEFKDIHLYDILESPHDNVIIGNHIQSNYSSGIYSDSGYMNYIIDNLVEDNEKEGMCLDYGSFGTYVCGNTIRRNGHRNRQTDEDLEADFILGAGRLEDGSSTAKLPGISLDNAAYNIIYQNNISDNDGSGVKIVRSSYRNIILSNIISDNNQGVNDLFHGFGIEIGYASTPDEPVIGLDFTAAFENIVARNVVAGSHYAGIFLAEGSYCNDLIDNVLMECEFFSIENHSTYFNSAVGNVFVKDTLNME